MNKRNAKKLAVAILGNECFQDSYLDDLPEDERAKVRDALTELGHELFRRAGLAGHGNLFGSIEQIRAKLEI